MTVPYLTVSWDYKPVEFQAEHRIYEGVIDKINQRATVVVSTGAARLHFCPTASECRAMAMQLTVAAEQIDMAVAVGRC